MTTAIQVLHVDDDPDFARMAADFLQREDDSLTITTATSASEGLNRLASDEFDCIVSDYEMPGMNGIEFLNTIREDYPDLPFILFTGRGSEEVASNAISAGVTDYLQKEHGTDQYAVLANRIVNAVEHVRSQKRVERSERRLRDLIDALPHFLYVVDTDERYRLANEPLADFHGLTVEELEGAHVADILSETEYRQFQEDFEDLLESGEPKHLSEIEITDPEGNVRVFEPELHPFELDDGSDAVLGNIVDITDRIEREREFERMRERIEFTLESTNSHIWVVDFESDKTEVYGPIEPLYGVEPAKVKDGEFYLENIVHPEDRDRVEQQFAAAFRHEQDSFDIEFRIRFAQGEVRWMETEAFLREEDRTTRLVGITTDITDRKKRQQAIESLHQTADAFMRADTEEEIAEIAVEAARDVLDMPASSFHRVDQSGGYLVPVAWTDYITELIGDPPALPLDGSLAGEVFETKETQYYDDVSTVGERFSSKTEMRSEIIVPVGEHGVFLASSTESNAFDETTVSLAAVLANHMRTALTRLERERTLKHQNDRLEEFASVVAHDLRNPLNVTAGQIDLARREGDNEHLVTAAEAVDRMEMLIDDLLTLAKQGQAIEEMDAVDLAPLVEACWGTVATADARLGIETDRTIYADRGRLQQFFENLFRNAVEHGGEDVTVTVGDMDDGFYVADDGPGIEEDHREEVFESGYSATKRGTGFGLSIVAEIVEAHGWDIGVTESESDGARFEITGVEFATE